MSLINRHKKMMSFEQDDSGNYRYVGNWQLLRSDGEKETRIVLRLLCLLAAGILAVGLIPGDATHVWYIMVPYAFSYLTAGVTIWCCITFMTSHWVLLEQEHKSRVGLTKGCLLLTAVLTFWTGAGQIANLIVNRPGHPVGNCLIAASAFAAFAAAAILRWRTVRRWHWELISEKERQRMMGEN